MTEAPVVDILLATWNGDTYLGVQIDSILAQTHTNWRLLIRDDGSSDGTPGIIRHYAAKFPDRIEIVDAEGKNLGACGNFAALLERSTADYAMFCDQDDIWLPEKVEVLLAKMQDMEGKHGVACPLLVHSDLKVADGDLDVVAPSFWGYQRLNPEKGRFLNRLLIQNTVTGCAMMMNSRLREIALPIHAQARMHDWWIALVAAAFGEIGYVRRPLVLYRQHGGNTLGAKRWDVFTLIRLLVTGLFVRMCREKQAILAATQEQAAVFAQCFESRLTAEQLGLVRAYASIPEQSFLARRATVLWHGFLLDGTLKKIGLMLLI